jgi:hypothetical protein
MTILRSLAAALLLSLAGCGIGAELGFLDESYKGSFIRGDLYAKACEKAFDGEWSWEPGTDPSCSRGPIDLIIDPLEKLL